MPPLAATLLLDFPCYGAASPTVYTISSSFPCLPRAHLVAARLVHLLSEGAGAQAELARVIKAAQDELQGGELVEQQRQRLALWVQRLMQPNLLHAEASADHIRIIQSRS